MTPCKSPKPTLTVVIFSFFIGITSLLTPFTLNAQPAKDMLNSVIPPSPNAAALGKYGEIPVSLYTGTANINIPIYEIKANGLAVPVSLSYHPSGIRLDEESSWVGLGWVLNAGGVITRSVAGVNDDDPSWGYLNTPGIPSRLMEYARPITGGDATTLTNYLLNATLNHTDPESDIYYFNFNGYSGKFVFDANGVPQTIPYSTLRIEANPHESPLTNFTVITEEGIKYKFGGTGYVEESRPEYAKYDDAGAFVSQTKLHQYFNSAWYLREIKTPNGEIVTFTYSPENCNTESNKSQTRFVDFNSNTIPIYSNNSTVKNYILGLRLSKINCS